jgi:hypothetical protein
MFFKKIARTPMVKNINKIIIASSFKPMNTRSNIQMESQVLGRRCTPIWRD